MSRHGLWINFPRYGFHYIVFLCSGNTPCWAFDTRAIGAVAQCCRT